MPPNANNMELAELKNRLNAMHISFDVRLERVDIAVLRDTYNAVMAMYREFPGAVGQINRITADASANAYASAHPYGYLNMNPALMGEKRSLQMTYARDLRSGFHPAGTKSEDIMIHEMGHQLEAVLVGRQHRQGTNAFVTTWNTHTVANSIVRDAVEAVHASGDRRPESRLIAEISGYAKKNKAETLAEAVADFYANRENAKPLSKEIWKRLKKELN